MPPHLRILAPHPNIIAFYDGRVAGYRFLPGDNWVDAGAIEVGIASYAIVDGHEALVYDTHVSVDHAQAIRDTLTKRGVTKITVVLSHWHLDHIAGTSVFADCMIVANSRTAAHLEERKSKIEEGTLEGPPSITPLTMPNCIFEDRLTLKIGQISVTLIHLNIHSDDATVLWLEGDRILLAGDTMEDSVTYVVDPQNFGAHLVDLDKLWTMAPSRILPNHGHEQTIANGGYSKTLIRATQQYIRVLQRCGAEPELRERPLKDVIAGPLSTGWITYFGGYEVVHRDNVAMVVANQRKPPAKP
jgi:cyclase